MRKLLRYTLRIAGLLLLFIVLFAIAVPLLFKDQIVESVRKTVDSQIEGAFYFEKAQIGILRTFPNLCLELTSPVLTGGKHPEGDSLFVAESLGIVVDIKSLIRRGVPLKIVGIEMIAPHISLYSDKNGVANYQLIANTDSTATDTSSSSAVVEIDDYRIETGSIKYRDDASEIEIFAVDLDHHGTLRYEDDNIELATETSKGILTIASEGIAYLDSVHVKGNNDLNIDLTNSVYTLLENNLTLNAFQVEASGVISQTDEATIFELDFTGDRNEFKNLISLLPNIYSSEFNDLKASGNIAVTGSLKGVLSDLTVPVYDVKLQVDNAAFQYPGKPLGFDEIAFHGALHNSAKDWLPVVVDLSSLHFLLNNRRFDANINIQNPAGKGIYAGEIKGIVDLTDLSKAYPLPQIQTLQGIVDADVKFDINSSKGPGEQSVSGKLGLQNILVRMQDEEIAMQSGNVDFTPDDIHAFTNSALINGSSLVTDLSVKDYIGWLIDNGAMTISGNVTMDKFDANRYLTSEESNTETDSATTFDPSLSLIRYDGNIVVNTLIYDTYIIENGSATLNGTLPILKVTDLKGKINGTSFTANGTLTNIHKYMDGVSPLTGVLDCNLDRLFVNRWIEEEPGSGEASASTETSYVALPDDLKLDITFRAEALQYDKIEIKNPRGTVHLEDRILEIHDFKGIGMGGEIAFSGLYNTQNIEHPAFSMKYDLKSIQFSEAFKQIETFQSLAPVAKFLQGVFNSALVFEGRLGENYFPDLSTLTAKGFLETLTGSLEQVDILDKVSQFLNLKKPLRWDLGGSRNWFEVKDGYVMLQEVTKSIDGIDVGIGGRHQIKGEMDYLIKLNIPADHISANPLGTLAKTGLEQLQTKAAAYGVKLNTIENFVVHVGMRGKFKDPKFQILLFDASGKSLKEVAVDQIKDIKQQVTDTITSIANEKIEEVRDSIRTVIDMAVDSARKVAEDKLREAGEKVVSETTARLDSTIRDSITNAILDKIGDKALDNLGKKETDKIKDALDKWDPFKKKKN